VIGDARRPGWAPSPVQEQLLAAALDPPEAAAAAWAALAPGFDLGRMERGSFELMPLVGRNLAAAGHKDARLAKLIGIQRRSWVKNNLLLDRLLAATAAFDARRIEFVVVEGPPQAERYYGDLGLRPTSTMHLLVKSPDIPSALAELSSLGWREQPLNGYPGWRVLTDDGNHICIVKARLAFDFLGTADSVAPWTATDRFDVRDASLPVPSPTHALLAAIVGGARTAPTTPTQWIADAVLIARTAQVGFDLLAHDARIHGQALRVCAAARYLRRFDNRFDALAAADASPTTRERVIYALTARSWTRGGATADRLAYRLAAWRREVPA
jgi:hypothetical protein